MNANNPKVIVIGGIYLDQAMRCNKIPAYGGSVCGTGFSYTVTGSGPIEAIEAALCGCEVHLIGKIGKGATLSAFCNQSILHKSDLPRVLELSIKMGAVGVNTAHSGTVIGILLPYDFSDMKELEERLEKKLNK